MCVCIATQGIVYIIAQFDLIWFAIISIWHDMQRPKFSAATPDAKLTWRILEVLSWCILLIGITNVMSSLFFPQSSFQTQEHMCIRGSINDLQRSHFMLGSGEQILCPGTRSSNEILPNTWPAPCSMGGSSNCLPATDNMWETALVFRGTSFSEQRVIPLHTQYSNASENRYHWIPLYSTHINHES